jgi:wee1-like protein kinase
MDIKAENILYSFSKKFKLGDLGLARVTTNLCDIREGDSRYLANEVLAQATEDISHIPDLMKADIFSLGAMCYEIMLGKPLPKNGPVWHKIRNAELEHCSNFSGEINQCIQKMMDPCPEKRPKANELLESVFLSEKQLQVKRWKNYAGKLEEEISGLKEKLGMKKRKFSM